MSKIIKMIKMSKKSQDNIEASSNHEMTFIKYTNGIIKQNVDISQQSINSDLALNDLENNRDPSFEKRKEKFLLQYVQQNDTNNNNN